MLAKYSALESMRDGRPIEIRALKQDDQAGLMATVSRSSTQSLYRRFFGLKRHFSDQQVAYFLNVDFVNHVALVAVIEEGSKSVIVGGGRCILAEEIRRGSF